MYLKETAVPSIIPNPNLPKNVANFSIVSIGGEDIVEQTDPDMQNSPNWIESLNSEIQETAFEIIGKIPDSPNVEHELKEKGPILVTPSKFKINKRLFSPSIKRKPGATTESAKAIKLKKKIKLLQQGIRRKDKKSKTLVIYLN